MSDLSSLVQVLPLPLAQLLRRSLNGKSAVERHHNAYYLAEAALKLAAAGRIGAWLERCLEPGSPLARSLESLALPSTGHWLGFLREVDRALAGRPDAALLPFGAAAGQLDRKRDWEGVRALARAAVEADVISAEVARATNQDGLLGFFALAVAYRNEVMGHGAQRRPAYYEQFGPLWQQALGEVLGARELYAGMRLVHARMTMTEAQTEPVRAWQDLTGLASLPLDGRVEAALLAKAAPGQLYLLGSGFAVNLHPLAVYREDEFGSEAVGFLNKTVRRTRQTAGGSVDEVRRADYLNYATGENLPGFETREALTGLLGRLRGRKVTGDDLNAAQDASVMAAGPETPEETVAAGSALGDYEILHELGRGGMGIVYKARQRSLNRVVALKVLPPALAADPVTLERFRREISALARCDHPNVVKILASGVDGDRYYYAMEYVDGADLGVVSRVLSRWKTAGTGLREGHIAAAISTTGGRAVLPAPEDREAAAVAPSIPTGRHVHERLAELFADAALGLEHLHERKIVHRDIKPQNLMLTSDGRRVVIMDLGLAQLGDASRGLTQGLEILGTLRYMAPEQAQRQLAAVDHRADIYGLGASLYELALGRPLHDGDTEARLLHQILLEEPQAPRQADRSIPRDLATIITVAVAKDPRRRYASARAMAADLTAFAEKRPIAAVPPSRLHKLGLYLRRNRALAAVAATLVVLAAGTWLYLWNAGRVRVQYCANVRARWQILECVETLDADSQQHRGVSFRVERRHGRVSRVDRINGQGQLVNDDDGYARWHFRYTEGGKVAVVTVKDRLGEVQASLVYSDDLRRQERRDRFGNPSPLPGTDATVQLFEYDARGYPAKQRFGNVYGLPRSDAWKAYGYDIDSDERGLQRRWAALGPDGNPVPTSQGVARFERKFDQQGNPVEETALGVDGKPVLDSFGWATRRSRYDAWGNLLEQTVYGTDGKPTLEKDGDATTRATFDEHGNKIRLEYFGVAGEPVIYKDGTHGFVNQIDERGNPIDTLSLGVDGKPIIGKAGFARARATYDEHNNQTQLSVFDAHDRPVIGWGSYATVRTKYDDHGHVIEYAYFGTDGAPRLNKDGAALVRIGHDLRGNAVEWANFGVDGKPIALKDGHSIFRKRFDERGNEVEESVFGVDDKPVAYSDVYYSVRRARFDEAGHEVEVSYLGVDGRPTLHKDGNAGSRKKYDERGNLIEVAFVGVDGEPVTVDGYAAWRRKYDDRGNVTEESYFGVDGRPIPVDNGFAILRSRFDARDNDVEDTFYDAEGKPTFHKQGYHRRVRSYDERGNMLREAAFGVDGKPVLNSLGWLTELRSYDERNNLVEEAYLGTDGEPVLMSSNVADVRMKYDERGNRTETTYFGIDHKPVLHSEGNAIWRVDYDEHGNSVRETYYGLDGKLVANTYGYAERRTRYDALDHMVEQAFFDPAGNRVLYKEGYAIIREHYDEAGRQIEEDFLGVDERPVLSNVGIATTRWKLDARGNALATSYFGVDGKPIRTGYGYARVEDQFDPHGNILQASFFDEDGKPIQLPDGGSSWRARYDDRGHRIEVSFFDAAGRPFVAKNGYAMMRSGYDERGNKVAEDYFGVDGKPVTTAPDGAAGWRGRFDPRGFAIEDLYLGVDGKPIPIKVGYAISRMERDRLGKITRQSYLGADGQPVLYQDGYASYTASYDAHGNPTRIDYTGLDGKPVLIKDGYAGWAGSYDDRGRQIEAHWSGLDGKPILDRSHTAGRKRSYDEHGNQIEERYVGLDGAPILEERGIAGWRGRYSARGDLIELRYFGLDDRPVLAKDGSAGYVAVYDPPTIENRRTLFDLHEEPISGLAVPPDGARFEWRLAAGKLTVSEPDGKPLKLPARRPMLETVARAALAGYRTSRLREVRRELWNGARGLLVTALVPGGQGEKLGLEPGDVLIEYAGERLDTIDNLIVGVTRMTAPTAKLVYLRGAERRTLEVGPGKIGVNIQLE